MAINKSIARPKLASTLTETAPLEAAVAEVNGQFVLDIYTTVTLDGGGTATNTLFRYYIDVTTSDTNLILSETIYAFDGDDTDYSAGGTTPASSQGHKGIRIINLDTFLTAAGDARKNS